MTFDSDYTPCVHNHAEHFIVPALSCLGLAAQYLTPNTKEGTKATCSTHAQELFMNVCVCVCVCVCEGVIFYVLSWLFIFVFYLLFFVTLESLTLFISVYLRFL